MFVHNQQEEACETVCRLFMIQKHSSLALAFKNGGIMLLNRKCETPERMGLAAYHSLCGLRGHAVVFVA